jgi:hypothetical protein
MSSIDAQMRQQAIEAGFDPNSAQGQELGELFRPSLQAEQQTQQNLAALQPERERINQQALVTQQQLRDAGLLGLSEQFRRAQNQQAFDAARRGVTGGSRDRERQAELGAQQEQGVANLFSSSAQQAEQQRQAGLAPLQAFEDQLRQGSPYEHQRRQAMTQDLQRQADAAQGRFSLDQQQEAIRSGSQMNQAQLVRDAFGTLATGINVWGQNYQPAQSGTALSPPSNVNPGELGFGLNQGLTPQGTNVAPTIGQSPLLQPAGQGALA